MRKPICLLLALCLALACAPAFADDRAHMTDNWYEIFVRSFRDSDGDRVGDFAGITERLDYLADLGIGGLWLMPIHPSPSYHGYDVTDYRAVNPEYGTMQDFEDMLREAHARGIRVIIDLVVNHTSNEHPWFQSARFEENSPYRAWYNWSDTQKSGYNKGGDAYYESRFVSSMPDLNLDNPDVLAEMESIMAFWLDKGVDGFRLDAVTSYYTGSVEKNVGFLRCLSETAKKIKPDCFIVGEAWDSLYVIDEYYESGLDSFFLFPVSQQGGYIAKIIREADKKGLSLGNAITLTDEYLGDELLSPFLGNHDTARIANVMGYRTATDLKMAMGLLSIMSGSLFVYYGDEIGMIGTGNDPNKRIGFFWDQKATITRVPEGATAADYPFGSLESQKENPLSIYRYYKTALNLRRDNPAIARGANAVIAQDDPLVCLIEKTYGEDQLLIAVNLSIDDKTIALPESARGYQAIAGEIEIWSEAALDGGALFLPAYGIAVLQ